MAVAIILIVLCESRVKIQFPTNSTGQCSVYHNRVNMATYLEILVETMLAMLTLYFFTFKE